MCRLVLRWLMQVSGYQVVAQLGSDQSQEIRRDQSG